MYVMLNYNIVDTDTGWGLVIGRTTGLLLILVTSSTLIELIQLILPVPEMITSAVFAAGVVAFIGWEEKIMKTTDIQNKKCHRISEIGDVHP